MKRYTTIFSTTTLPRQSIDVQNHGHVDASLRELRTLSRRLTASLSSFSNELQLLERLYYKGKNQHRSALFWQKVVEIRRLGARINGVDIHGLVEGLRCSFHASEAKNNAKKIRSAWIQTPDVQACKDVLVRLRAVCLLVDRARPRFLLAYRSFTQQLRTATFLPLTISLLAITSRLDFLLVELRDIIALLWDAIMRVIEVIDLTSDIRTDGNVLLPMAPSPSGQEAVVTKSERPRKKPKVFQERAEDLGSKVLREIGALDIPQGAKMDPASTTEFNPPNDSTQVHNYELSMVSAHLHHDMTIRRLPSPTERPSHIEPLPPPEPTTFHAVPSSHAEAPAHTKPPSPSDIYNLASIHAHRPLMEKKALKAKSKSKAQRKRDEIDDIFGF